jgi:hypothetical protein
MSEEKETIVTKVERCCINQKLSFWRVSGESCVLALSSKGRVFVLPSIDLIKNLQAHSSIIGAYKYRKELREQDKRDENLSIEQCEKLATTIITKEEIKEHKIGTYWGFPVYTIILNTGQKIDMGTLDQTNMKKLFSNL